MNPANSIPARIVGLQYWGVVRMWDMKACETFFNGRQGLGVLYVMRGGGECTVCSDGRHAGFDGPGIRVDGRFCVVLFEVGAVFDFGEFG